MEATNDWGLVTTEYYERMNCMQFTQKTIYRDYTGANDYTDYISYYKDASLCLICLMKRANWFAFEDVIDDWYNTELEVENKIDSNGWPSFRSQSEGYLTPGWTC